MQVSKIMRNVKIPAKVERGIGAKYPIDQMTVGDSVLIVPEKGDEVRDLKILKKRIAGSIKQAERRLGKLPDGRKVKDFAVWIDDKRNGVCIGLREDNSGIVTKKPAGKQVSVVKNTPPAVSKTKSRVVAAPPTKESAPAAKKSAPTPVVSGMGNASKLPPPKPVPPRPSTAVSNPNIPKEE